MDPAELQSHIAGFFRWNWILLSNILWKYRSMLCWIAFFSSTTRLQPVSCKVITINFALGTATEMQEFSLSQKFRTSAKIFSNATMLGQISQSRFSSIWMPNFSNCMYTRIIVFFAAEIFPALYVCCSSVFLDPKSKCAAAFHQTVPQHFLSFLGFH